MTAQDRSNPTTQLFIGGEWVAAADKATTEIHCPADGKTIATISVGAAADIDRAVAAADAAFTGVWTETPPRERGLLLLRLADLMERDREVIAKLEALEIGRPFAEPLMVDVPSAIATLRHFAGWADKLDGRVLSSPDHFGRPVHSYTTRVARNDIVLLHGCCHNPTGADLSPDQWNAVGDVILSRGLLPFVDIAYQGFGDGLEQDAAGVRALAARVPEMVISTSCSKNFGVYRDRVGTAMIIGATGAAADKAKAVLLSAGRVNYSFPPNHGGAMIALLLSDAALTADWTSELDDMRNRLLGNRAALAGALRSATNSDRFDFITSHKGMFSLLGLTTDQILQLRKDAAIFIPPDGRINIAAVNESDLGAISNGIAAVIR